jgi:hypothetical protein
MPETKSAFATLGRAYRFLAYLTFNCVALLVALNWCWVWSSWFGTG